MVFVYRTSFKLLFIFALMLLLGFHATCSTPEDLEQGIVKIVDKESSSSGDSTNSNTQKSSSEEVVELEETDSSEGAPNIVNPEQVYEACLSLQESFKDCKEGDVSESLGKLVDACNDPVLNIQDVVSVSSEINQSLRDFDISELGECSAMIDTSSLFISSANASYDEEEEDGSLEVESLETDSSHIESESEDN